MSSSFAKYLNDHPEYRKKHMEYIKEKVLCPDCNIYVQRSNMTHHKKGRGHQTILKQKNIIYLNDLDNDELIKLMEKIKEKLNET